MTLVVGSLEKQARHLPTGVICWPKDRPLARLNEVDKVILMTKFISHSQQDEAVRLYGRDRVRRVFGGLSAVKREL